MFLRMSATRLVLSGHTLAPGPIEVPPEVAHHARVARVEIGDAIEILNLDGAVATGTLARWDGGACIVLIDSVEHERGEAPEPFALALAVLHTAAFDWAVEKATELGASEIVPLLTERVQGRDHMARMSRWQRIAAAAITQCGRSRVPRILDPRPLARFLADAAYDARFIADRSVRPPRKKPKLDGHGIAVLIGPEGGLTDTEVRDAVAAGFVGMRLGPRILRAETAAIAALTVAQERAGWLK